MLSFVEGQGQVILLSVNDIVQHDIIKKQNTYTLV